MASNRIAPIQWLRAVAATLVLHLHASMAIAEGKIRVTGPLAPSIPNLGMIGASGVDLFFVISGFVMAHSLASMDATPWTLLKARWRRIAPLYAIVTLVFASIVGEPVTPAALLQALTLLPVLDGRIYHMPLLAVGWSLGFELAFYILVAVALRTPHRRIALLLLLTAGAALAGVFVHASWAPLRLLLNPLQFEFALGILVWIAWRRGITARVAAPALVAGIVLLTVGLGFGLGIDIDVGIESAVDGGSGLARTWTWGMPWALVVVGVIDTPRGRGARWMERIGDASYSTYLTHPALLALVAIAARQAPALHPVVVAGGLIAASTLLGLAVHAHVERPLLRHMRPGYPGLRRGLRFAGRA